MGTRRRKNSRDGDETDRDNARRYAKGRNQPATPSVPGFGRLKRPTRNTRRPRESVAIGLHRIFERAAKSNIDRNCELLATTLMSQCRVAESGRGEVK